MVFPAVVTEPVRLLQPTAVPPEVPLYPGASGVLVTTSRDPLGRSKIVTFLDDGSLEANVTFYRAELQRRGWIDETKASAHRAAGDDLRLLLFTRDGAECTLSFLKIDEARTRVHLTLVNL
jgi:hypothetical protein